MTDDRTPVVRLEKRKTPWGNTSWDVWVGDEFVGNYRLRADAKRVGAARVASLAEAGRQWDEDMRLEHGE